MSATEPQTNYEMYSRGVDGMIMALTGLGCNRFKETPIVDRLAANASAIKQAGFDTEELRIVLAIALDRLAGLALEGAGVYGTYEDDHA